MNGLGILLALIVPMLTDSVVHRGDGSTREPGSTALPENSLPAFLKCWERGFIPEGDVRRSKDGVFFAFHDPSYKGRRIEDYSWEEVQTIDIARIGRPDLAASSVRAPTWEAIFDEMKKDPRRRILLDKSGPFLKPLSEMVNARGIGTQCYFCAGGGDPMVWKRLVPGGKALLWIWTGTWKRVDIRDAAVAAAIEDNLEKRLATHLKDGFAGWDIVQIHVRVDRKGDDYVFAPSPKLLTRAVREAKKCGRMVQLMPWTGGNDPEVYRRLASFGCDAFATDFPDVIQGFSK